MRIPSGTCPTIFESIPYAIRTRSKPDEEKKKTILLLDAVDESPLAEDPAQRQELDRLLNEICQHHAYVHL